MKKDIFKAMGVQVTSDRSLVETPTHKFTVGTRADMNQPVRKGLGPNAAEVLNSQLTKGGVAIFKEPELKRVSPHAKEEEQDDWKAKRKKQEAKADEKFKADSSKKHSYEGALENTHGEQFHTDIHESAKEVSQAYEIDREFGGETRPATSRKWDGHRTDNEGEKVYDYDFKSMSAEDYIFLKAMGEDFSKAEEEMCKKMPIPSAKPSMRAKKQPKSKEESRVERQQKREMMGKPVKKGAFKEMDIENTLDSLIDVQPDSFDPEVIANVHENSDDVVERKVIKGKDSRCWDGYKPAKGKKPYSEGSCVKKSELDEVFDLIKGDTPASKKISKLVHEGKPQKQAVATALNMEKQGKLGPQGGYKKSFVKAAGPGGIVMDFGPLTGNPIADAATKLLNQNSDYVQSENAKYQANSYQDAITKFVTKGEKEYMGQTTPFGHISKEGAEMLNKPMDQQVRESYERGEFDKATSTPGMAKSRPITASTGQTIAPPIERSIPNIPEFEKSNTRVGGVQVHAQSPTDAAVIEMMKGYLEGQSDTTGVVADIGPTGGKVGITAGELPLAEPQN